MTLTKHSKERYVERFGIQDEKEILRRANLAVTFQDDGKGITKRVWGNIVFVVLDQEVITTIHKK